MQTHHILHFISYSNSHIGKSSDSVLPQRYRLAVTLFQACYIKSVLFSNLAVIDRLVNIVEDFAKPLSLNFRLFGNVVADELTVAVICSLVPFIVPVPIMMLGLFASSIQALIFSTLAANYIAEVIE